MATSKKKDKGEQTSHKVIEKRRRDRINNCLAELSQTVPVAFAKQSSGKLEKAEILEMTVDYLRAIQSTEIGRRFEHGEWYSADIWGDFTHYYQTGYSDCMRECVRYLADVEGLDTSETRCVRMLSYIQSRFRHDMAASAGGAAYRESVSRQLPLLGSGHGQLRPYSTATSSQSHVTSPYSVTSTRAITTPTQTTAPVSVSQMNTPSHAGHPPHHGVRSARRMSPYATPPYGNHASPQLHFAREESAGAEYNKLLRSYPKETGPSSVNPFLGVFVKSTLPSQVKLTGIRRSISSPLSRPDPR